MATRARAAPPSACDPCTQPLLLLACVGQHALAKRMRACLRLRLSAVARQPAAAVVGVHRLRRACMHVQVPPCNTCRSRSVQVPECAHAAVLAMWSPSQQLATRHSVCVQVPVLRVYSHGAFLARLHARMHTDLRSDCSRDASCAAGCHAHCSCTHSVLCEPLAMFRPKRHASAK